MLGIKLMLLGIGLLLIANVVYDWPIVVALVGGLAFLVAGLFVKGKPDK